MGYVIITSRRYRNLKLKGSIMKVAFHTLGCKVNQYETEAMKEQFKSFGAEIADENDFADVKAIHKKNEKEKSKGGSSRDRMLCTG